MSDARSHRSPIVHPRKLSNMQVLPRVSKSLNVRDAASARATGVLSFHGPNNLHMKPETSDFNKLKCSMFAISGGNCNEISELQFRGRVDDFFKSLCTMDLVAQMVSTGLEVRFLQLLVFLDLQIGWFH